MVNGLMQKGYTYVLTAPIGGRFDPDFEPELPPKELLSLGIFGGKYMTDCAEEFPDASFEEARLCSSRHDLELNYYAVSASQPLSEWRRKGWVYSEDARGWFQWYCRYYMGRRCLDDER